MAKAPVAPVLSRVIFGLALFGLLVVIHLHFQAKFGFDRGCLGFTNPAETVGCAEVVTSGAGMFLGVSNVIWGGLFYFLVAALRFLYGTAQPASRERLRLASFATVGAGFLYAMYLTGYQFFSPELADVEACVLCLISASIVTLLLILHVVEHMQLRENAGHKLAYATKPFAVLAGVFLVLIAADVVFAGRLLEPPQAQTAENNPAGFLPEDTQPVNLPLSQQQLPPVVNITDPATQCHYDENQSGIKDLSAFLTGAYQGEADAPVRVVEFFDPNCPHCKDLSEDVEAVAAAMGDKARFYYVPFPLRETSFGQVVALRLAEREGKFLALMEAMFQHQDATWGMTLDEVVEAANEAGMDGAGLRTSLEDVDALRPILDQIMIDRVAATDIIADAQGRTSVPKLFIDGKLVEATYDSYSQACLTYFINEAYGTRQ